jgi:hypothetical protein
MFVFYKSKIIDFLKERRVFNVSLYLKTVVE